MESKQEIRAFAVKVASDHTDCPICMMTAAEVIAEFIETGEWEPIEFGCVVENDQPEKTILESIDVDSLPRA